MDNPLSKVPLLEEVTSVFLMCWMDLWKVDHLLHKLLLSETLVHKKIILLMHSSVATLTGSLEDLESSSKGSRVVGLIDTLRVRPGYSEMMSVPHTVSRVTKSRSTPLECIMDTPTGHPRLHGTLTTQPP